MKLNMDLCDWLALSKMEFTMEDYRVGKFNLHYPLLTKRIAYVLECSTLKLWKGVYLVCKSVKERERGEEEERLCRY